jgi:hypothetical protein
MNVIKLPPHKDAEELENELLYALDEAISTHIEGLTIVQILGVLELLKVSIINSLDE